jgi:hypothetical protein
VASFRLGHFMFGGGTIRTDEGYRFAGRPGAGVGRSGSEGLLLCRSRTALGTFGRPNLVSTESRSFANDLIIPLMNPDRPQKHW